LESEHIGAQKSGKPHRGDMELFWWH